MFQGIFVTFLLLTSFSLTISKFVDVADLHVKTSGNGRSIQAKLSALGHEKTISLHRPQPGHSVLAQDVVVLTANINSAGKTVYEKWSPTLEERKAAERLYVDPKTRSILKPAGKNSNVWSGLMDGISITNDGEKRHFASRSPEGQRMDYIDLGRNLTYSQTSGTTAVNAIVETVLVLDKEFGDIFGHNRQQILDYATVYMWDVNNRYRTLTSDQVSFRINGVVIIANTAAQPFIEDSRGPDGRIEFGRVLNLDEYRYPKWVFDQIPSWPKFDLAPLMTNAEVEWGGGLAYMNAACWVDNNARRHIGVAVWNDNGAWGSLTVGAHEIGHNMGAPHDDDENFPGGCSERGYIMGGGNDDLRWMFSSCSDRTISSFVNSNGAACVRTIEGSPILNPEFNAVQPPSMEEQCKRQLNDPTAWIDWNAGGTTCKALRCLRSDEDGTIWIHWRTPVDNTPCEGGSYRCFRGRCREQGFFIKNVGSGLCARPTNSNEFTAILDMVPCPSTGTPLDRFVLSTDSSGTTLATPFTKGPENGDKCVYTGSADGGHLWTDRCGDRTNPWHRWDFRDVGSGQFQLAHRVTGRCAKPSDQNVGSAVQSFACDSNDQDMKWTRYL